MKSLPKAVVNQIMEELRPEKQQPGDVTVAMAMKEWNVKRSKAYSMLEQAIKEGKLEKLKGVLDTGRYGILYRPCTIK